MSAPEAPRPVSSFGDPPPQGPAARAAQLPPGAGKIRPSHRERLAVVYVRQSTPQQVAGNRESTELQYALAQRAVALGWPQERVLIIDEDQGRSAESAEGRLGFQRLLAEVGLDHVGLVLGIEMSRLARSCKDWHQLLELCALFRTLLADQDGLYDPTDFNDRLLLGLKGTFSEAELHTLRGRLNEGRLNKARRGELFSHPPIGYVRLRSGELVFDPDEQAREVVRLVFDLFERWGTVNKVLQYLVRHQIRLGIRPHSGPNRGQLEWRRPSRTTLLNLLHHPTYAGAYCYGRRPIDPRRKRPGCPGSGRTRVAAEDCLVLLRDRCPAYISWDRYQANQRQVEANRARAESRGAIREGAALLGGLLVCGRCGYRMSAHYDGPDKRPHYLCEQRQVDYGGSLCQGLAGRGLDALVAQQVLEVLEPAALELSLAAAVDIEAERERLHRHWQQQLERAGYEAERAARQYHAVEPENRLVARELERRWEAALQAQRQLEENYHRFQSEQPRGLSPQERDAVRALAAHIPDLWGAETTTAADRKAIARHLIDRVVVAVRDDSEYVDVTIHWLGGMTSEHELIRPVGRYEQLRDYEGLLGRLLELREQGRSARQIAEQLNGEGWRPPRRRATFNAPMVRKLISRRVVGGQGANPTEATALLESDEWWFGVLARQLDMPPATLYSWLRRGWVQARQLPGACGRWIVWADEDELGRLRRLRARSRSWSEDAPPKDLTTPKTRPGT
jgi:DNA invertase Pin-like site-specific DNA recombinase